ncbi:twin-arginine translocase subunit TatC [Paenibacillus mucilaginosus]|uniref:Sec-independent protein translocase protein TatC n=2 Tax=Paenibacillus mucilaginosus TaxID=61624 RepID=H6NSW2_9BACL|nr:twin-arginine translocase subunit TatC [Paenibacillus mucilaginosus]AEI39216.1 Sec-independent protein translocase, TatC subunit [Paenibacillus mucilaginosus KNP414]AFC27503.1 Sec-independent protein translocase, TatC subunit [Paenibacillus mucilaginosus 3016]MCG7217141.1 twin-arginine translocase subunit TatC [Paenibacillus mucilaginosus]WDM28226.1 twin-arginine translocase subunit TatC [Paenibacillus mucilaginosus]WFA16404.1 twin-arginine translocase subunit TatC [Paenibacillus mucilagino
MNHEEEGMTLVEHLTELRKRIVWVLLVLVLGMVVGLVYAKPLILYLQSIAPIANVNWHTFSPWEPIKLYMNFSLVTGLLIALPFALYQTWAFLKPGLREVEQKASLLYVPFAFFMFLLGLAFGYFVVFKMAFLFTSSISANLQLTETYGAAQYFSFMFNILLPIALVFELPIVVMFLTKIRVLNPLLLKKVRRYAYLALVVIATMITPPDAVSAIVVALPMILLYEFSVFLSATIYRKQLLDDQAWEAEAATLEGSSKSVD